jgi:HEAT repeat protein
LCSDLIVVIRASSSREIAALIADLSADNPVQRDAAVARLSVIGVRAVERLVALVDSTAPPKARTAALGALEAIGDLRAVDAALHVLDDQDAGVASAAATTARAFLRGPRGAVVIDRLTGAAVDTRRDARVRLAAIQALGGLEGSSLKPLWTSLAADPHPEIRRLVKRVRSPRESAVRDPIDEINDAADRELPEDPDTLRDALTRARDTVPLTAVHRLIERLREREAGERAASRREEWMRVRAAAHVTLASRASRLAVYDLRETLRSADGPLPVEFLAALSQIGDATCLHDIAAAYGRSSTDNQWWRERLSDTFRTIVAREGITRRHRALRKIQKDWPDLLDARPSTPSRTTPRPPRHDRT